MSANALEVTPNAELIAEERRLRWSLTLLRMAFRIILRLSGRRDQAASLAVAAIIHEARFLCALWSYAERCDGFVHIRTSAYSNPGFKASQNDQTLATIMHSMHRQLEVQIHERVEAVQNERAAELLEALGIKR